MPVPELASEKACVSMTREGAGTGRGGMGDERVWSHQSSSKSVPLGEESGTCGLSRCVAMRRSRPVR